MRPRRQWLGLLRGPSASPLGDVHVPSRAVVATVALLVPLAGAAAPSSDQLKLMREFHRCLEERSSDPTQPTSTCTIKNADVLVGVSRAELLSGLGDPSFCIGARNEFLAWRRPECDGRLGIGYEFDRPSCRTCVGGGLELIFAFDSADRVKSTRWVVGQ